MILCLDIGGSAIKPAFFRGFDAIEILPRIETPGRDLLAFVAAIEDVLARAGERPSCVSISIAGVVDPENGRMICANIPCIHGRNLAAVLEEALDIPVLVANDADCFALAEAETGAGQGHRIVFGAILGTGVGGGMVVDGNLVNADGGFAGEWGHGPGAPAFAGHPPAAIPAYACGCGQTGCVDTVGGARGLERLHELLHGARLSSEAITAAWHVGEAEAERSIDVFTDLVSSPLSVVVNLTGATIVPVGGGLARDRRLIAEIDRLTRQKTLRRFHTPLVVPGSSGNEPGLVGAAVLALRHFPDA